MNQTNIIEGVIIGAVGGAIAGLVIWLAELCRQEILKYLHTKRVENWLKESKNVWRSTTAIASANNLTKDRVCFICSNSKEIKLNTKDGNESDEKWCLKSRENEVNI